MTDFLTIAGSPVDVVAGTGTQLASLWTGSLERNIANTLLDSRTSKKRVWKFATPPMTQTAAAALVATCEGGAVAVAGAAIPAGGVTAIVTVDDSPFLDDGQGVTFARVLNLTVNEV